MDILKWIYLSQCQGTCQMYCKPKVTQVIYWRGQKSVERQKSNQRATSELQYYVFDWFPRYSQNTYPNGLFDFQHSHLAEKIFFVFLYSFKSMTSAYLLVKTARSITSSTRLYSNYYAQLSKSSTIQKNSARFWQIIIYYVTYYSNRCTSFYLL